MKKIYVGVLLLIMIVVIIVISQYNKNENEEQKEVINLEVINMELEKNNGEDANYLKTNDIINFAISFNELPNQNIYVLMNNQKLDYQILKNSIKFNYHIVNNVQMTLKVLYFNNEIYSYDLPSIDDEPPKCLLEKDNTSLKIFGSDNVGIVGYAITKNDEYEFSMNNEIKYDSRGTWYGYIKDYAGNVGTCQINIPDEYVINPSEITIVGDSRMVGLCNYNWYKQEGGSCVAKVSAGYRWLVDEAINEVNSIAFNKKKNIVINLGVNDLESFKSYVTKYQLLANNDWKNSNIFLLSVNPTDGKESYLNQKIDSFNENLKNSFIGFSNVTYCDSSNYLKQNGFQTRDGVHYQETTYKIIYEQIKKCLYDYYNH